MLGIFVGLVLGLAVAAAIAYFLGKSGLTGVPAVPGVQREIVRNGKPETVPATSIPEKPRFDFYKILPGAEEPKLPKAPETQPKPVDLSPPSLTPDAFRFLRTNGPALVPNGRARRSHRLARVPHLPVASGR